MASGVLLFGHELVADETRRSARGKRPLDIDQQRPFSHRHLAQNAVERRGSAQADAV